MFIGTGIHFAEIVTWIVIQLGNIVSAMSEVQFVDTTYSIVDVFFAIAFFELIFHFMEEIIDHKSRVGGDDEEDEVIDIGTPVSKGEGDY